MISCNGVFTTRAGFLWLALSMLLATEAGAQGNFTLRMRGQDGGSGVDTLLYGRDPRGTYCIDPVTFFEGSRGFQEFELPPPPPSGVFDFRFSNHRSGLGGCVVANERGNGLRYDIRAYTGAAQIDTFQMKFQIGTAGPISLFWQTDLGVFCDSIRLKDLFGGFLVNVDMRTTQTTVVTNGAITQLNILMYRAPGLILIAPSDGVVTPTSLTLSWNGNGEATIYRVQVATDSLFSNLIVHDSTVTATSRFLSGLPGGVTFYWRISAGNDMGWGAFSQRRSFTTMGSSPPAVPSLVSPANGASDLPVPLPFIWNAAANATSYHLQVSSDSNFTSGFAVNDSTVTDTSRVVSGLNFLSLYYWRVRAKNESGSSAFSARRSFSTQVQPPPAPTQISPTDGQTGVTLPVTFTWSLGTGGGSITFRLQVGTDSTFTTGVVFDDSTITTFSQLVGSLVNGTKYYWRMRAKDGSSIGPYSPTRNFTTVFVAPAAPGLVSPASGATNQPTSLTFIWNRPSGATNYRLQISSDSNFTASVFDDSTLTDTTRVVSNLSFSTTYYWHVNARNVAGSSAFSSRRSFTTQAQPPPGPPSNAFTLRFRGQDAGGGVDTLFYGRDPRGSYCIDPVTFYEGTRGFQEFELPPPPPTGVFDIRFSNHRLGLGGCTAATERGNGLRYDIRTYTGATQIDTFQIKFQIGTAAPMSLFWQPDLGIFCDSIRLKDLFGGFIVNVDMRTTQTYVVTNGAITQLNIIMYRAPGVSLIAPSNGNTVPPTLTLSWNQNEDATKYRVQVATDSLFNNFVVHDSTVIATSRVVSGLATPGTYYWRIAAGNDLGWGAFSQKRVFFTGSVPAAPMLVSPLNGATSQPTSLTFFWNPSTGGSSYHLQVAIDSNFATGFAVNDSALIDTSKLVSGLGFSTTYYWRVRARNGVGAGAFSLRRSFATSFQPPPAPTLSSPPNGQTNTPTTVTFSWTIGGGGSVTYRLQVGTDSTFGSGVFFDDSTITSTSRLVSSLLNSTTYFWRVRAKNGAGYGPPSQTFSFSTGIAAPIAPTPVSPADGATNVTLTPTLQWNAAATATSYRLQAARDTAFTQISFDDSTIATTSRQIGPLLSNTNYFWRVRGKNSGGSGPYSTRFRFLTTAAPPIPSQLVPTDSATRVERTSSFVWNRVPGATGYHLQVATDPAFTTLLLNDSTITDSARLAGPFPYGARLHWRIRSRNTAGVSSFSSSRVFTIMLQPPGTPTLVSPANNAGNQPVTPTLRWQSTLLASGYQIQIALDTLMTNIVLTDTGVVDSLRVVRVAPSTAHYWRVRAHNTEGTLGSYSVIRRFNTGNFAPATPIPYYPVNLDTNVSRTPTLRWVESPGALYYRVQVSLDNLFTQIVAQDSLVPGLLYQPGLLQANTLHYWRVRARGTAGSSAYSVIQRFTTGILIVSVGDPEPEQPKEFVLFQNYPNPFNPSTTIPFSIPRESFVTVKIYNMMGEEVFTAASGTFESGLHNLRWEGVNSNGQAVTSGVYLIRMIVAESGSGVFSSTKKVLLLK